MCRLCHLKTRRSTVAELFAVASRHVKLCRVVPSSISRVASPSHVVCELQPLAQPRRRKSPSPLKTIKSVKMLNSGTDSLDSILNSGHNGSSKYGLRFDASMRSAKFTSKRNVPQVMLLLEMEPKEELLQKKTLIEGQKIIRIRSDHGKEFDNEDLNNFCQLEGIHHEFAAPIAPQQNGAVERKNSYETINVVVNDFESNVNQFSIEDDETSIIPDVTSTLLKEIPKADSQPENTKINSEKITDKVMNDETVLVSSAHVKKNHPPSSIIGDPSAGITTSRKEKLDYTKMIADLCYVSSIEPTSVESALKDEYWINTMQEELLQFKRNNVWTLVPKLDGMNVIGTKWIFKNKIDESGYVTKNKARLMTQGYAQVEGIDFDETFAPVAKL
ncbi:putative mitochondrial protein [Cucumis melo var. makuwa]|uniref:Mitochondrial protein n=1 Tax=Cucumis melo var. makuwa TaxID=1194695 RepID=A0A5D3DRJ5_CUCMM|nr:putative mitochondrial protein [Cucumis melo var. makuwa]TYK26263.1 putative mitochondrial protein [Cucumis melo var. makuwa]